MNIINSKKDDLLLEEIEKITPNSLEFDGTDLTLKMGGGAISTLLSVCEYGSNENGHFLKFENGTLICWRKHSISSPMNGGSWDWIYPYEFIDTPLLLNAQYGYRNYSTNVVSWYTYDASIREVYDSYSDAQNYLFNNRRLTLSMEASMYEWITACVLGRWK